jgi:hypothetical protein
MGTVQPSSGGEIQHKSASWWSWISHENEEEKKSTVEDDVDLDMLRQVIAKN